MCSAVQFRSVWCQQQSDNCSLPGACGQMFHLANFVLTAGLCGGQVTGTAQHAASTISPHAWSATSAPAQGEPTLASWEDDEMLACCMCCLILPLHSGHGRPLPPGEDSALPMILCGPARLSALRHYQDNRQQAPLLRTMKLLAPSQACQPPHLTLTRVCDRWPAKHICSKDPTRSNMYFRLPDR